MTTNRCNTKPGTDERARIVAGWIMADPTGDLATLTLHCATCAQVMTSYNVAQADAHPTGTRRYATLGHMVPFSTTGTYARTNLIPMCNYCNDDAKDMIITPAMVKAHWTMIVGTDTIATVSEGAAYKITERTMIAESKINTEREASRVARGW